MNRSIFTCLAIVALLAGGCAAHWPEQDTSLKSEQAEFQIPPKVMMTKIKEVVSQPPISLGIQEESKGSILTGFQEFPGAWHIGRRWQERTQYRIQVIPDFDEPTAKCTVQVRERTETRAADGMKWSAQGDLYHPERAEALLKTIQQKLAGQTTNP
jgi:hypothetical protein